MRRGRALLCLAVVACPNARPVMESVPPLGAPAVGDWLREQRAICGEVAGRVIDWQTRQPLASALISIDGTTVLTGSDSLGRFRISRRAEHPQPAMLRVRRIGLPSTVVELSRSLDKAYVVEIALAGDEMHQDGFAAVVVREAWMCEPAT